MKKQLLSFALMFLAYAGINAQILTDDIESYTLGAIGPQSADWTTWSGTEGGAEDGIVSDEQAASGVNSVLIAEGGAQDVVLLLGDLATGAYELTWNMFVPADASGYYNFQGEPTIGTDFVLEIYLNDGGTAPGVIAFGASGSTETATYPEDTWFEVTHQIDLGSDIISILIDGAAVYSGPYTGTTANLSSIDFFSISATNRYYLDDISLDSYLSCPVPGALICDNFEAYNEGALGPQSTIWTTWSGTEGGAEDGIVSLDYAFSGDQSMVIEEGGAQDVILLTGDLTSGRYSLSWKTYFEDISSTGYYNFQGSPVIGETFVQQFFFNSGGAAEGVYSNDLSDSLTSFGAEQWFIVNHIVDLDNDVMHVMVNGFVVATDIPYTSNLSSIDFFSIDDANRMYIDDVILEELDPVVACDPTDVIYCENFDEFITGPFSFVGPWSDEWTTWSGNEGGSEDGIISTEQAASGANSMLIAEGGAQDVVVLLGDESTGAYEVTFNMYIPAGATGYYNFQGEPTIGTDFVQQIFFNNGGAAAGTVEVEGVATGTYPEDAWFEMKHLINLDTDMMEVLVDGVSVGVGAYAGTTGNLSSMDFFSIDAANRYYLDDFTLAEGVATGTACELGSLFLCDNFDSYAAGSTTGPNADWWTTWSGTEGGAEDGIVSDSLSLSGANSMLIAEGGSQDVVLLLGDQTQDIWDVTFNMYIPTGATGYYNFQGEPTIGTDFVQQIFFNNGGAAAGTIEVEGVGTGTYPEATWFEVKHIINLNSDVMDVYVDGTLISSGAYTGTTGNLSSMDFFSIDASNRYYLDDVTVDGPLVGVDELSSSALSIYPNPNNGEFTIVNDAKAGLYTVRVTDLTGRAIMNQAVSLGAGTAHVVRLKDVTAGVYIVQLVNEDNSAVRIVKMIVE